MKLPGGLSWDDLPDDRGQLWVLSQDYRLSWDEPEEPVTLAARAKLAELQRRDRALPLIRRALRRAPAAPPLSGQGTRLVIDQGLSNAVGQSERRP